MYPHGESNPGFRTENPTSWATRRWGQSCFLIGHADNKLKFTPLPRVEKGGRGPPLRMVTPARSAASGERLVLVRLVAGLIVTNSSRCHSVRQAGGTGANRQEGIVNVFEENVWQQKRTQAENRHSDDQIEEAPSPFSGIRQPGSRQHEAQEERNPWISHIKTPF